MATPRESSAFDLVYLNVYGSMPHQSLGDTSYFVMFIDDLNSSSLNTSTTIICLTSTTSNRSWCASTYNLPNMFEPHSRLAFSCLMYSRGERHEVGTVCTGSLFLNVCDGRNTAGQSSHCRNRQHIYAQPPSTTMKLNYAFIQILGGDTRPWNPLQPEQELRRNQLHQLELC